MADFAFRQWGETMGQCTGCGGSGRVTRGYASCYSCGGSGRHFSGESCMACGGSGRSSTPEYGACFQCGGSGTIGQIAGGPANHPKRGRETVAPSAVGRVRGQPDKIGALGWIIGLVSFFLIAGWLQSDHDTDPAAAYILAFIGALILARFWKAMLVIAIVIVVIMALGSEN
jgi:hypothetical protein